MLMYNRKFCKVATWTLRIPCMPLRMQGHFRKLYRFWGRG